jgi:hypothetical protein
VNFEDERVESTLSDPSSDNYEEMNKFIECLGICHTLVSEEKTVKG